MPTSVQIGFIVLGGFLVLVGILGGNFKLFGGEVAEKISNPFLRFVAFLFGTVLLIAASQSPTPTNSDRLDPTGGKNSGSYTTNWTCYNNGKSVGDVTIWWGHQEGDAKWACNKWVSTCGNGGGCTARKTSQ